MDTRYSASKSALAHRVAVAEARRQALSELSHRGLCRIAAALKPHARLIRHLEYFGFFSGLRSKQAAAGDSVALTGRWM